MQIAKLAFDGFLTPSWAVVSLVSTISFALFCSIMTLVIVIVRRVAVSAIGILFMVAMVPLLGFTLTEGKIPGDIAARNPDWWSPGPAISVAAAQLLIALPLYWFARRRWHSAELGIAE